MEFRHIPVLLNETIEGLNIKSEGIYLDGTLGGGGHSKEICRMLSAEGHLIGIDQDSDAIEAASENLKEYSDRITIVRDNYVNFRSVLDSLGYTKIDGILLDIGVSSHQLDDRERGFSFKEDAPLDMRMDRRNPVTAADIVNTYTQSELFRIIHDYGEDGFARNIAKHIVTEREKAPIRTTLELAEIVKRAVPARFHKNGHPAKQTFQAIRIELNNELSVLQNSLDSMIDSLKPGGRLCVITFHSLEDRIVKQCFQKNENPCTCPPDFPVCVCNKKPSGHIVGKKHYSPSEEELIRNPRAKSAHLRVFEKDDL